MTPALLEDIIRGEYSWVSSVIEAVLEQPEVQESWLGRWIAGFTFKPQRTKQLRRRSTVAPAGPAQRSRSTAMAQISASSTRATSITSRKPSGMSPLHVFPSLRAKPAESGSYASRNVSPSIRTAKTR
jgi:hypothetical protein